MVRLGRDLQSRTDYILGTDRCLFRNVSIQDPRHISDHYIVLGCLFSAPIGNTPSTLGSARGFSSNPRPPQQGRADFLRPYRRRSQNQRQGGQGRTPGYRNPCGGSSTRESQCARNQNKTKPSCGDLDVQSTQA